jgi:hypothetical protein
LSDLLEVERSLLHLLQLALHLPTLTLDLLVAPCYKHIIYIQSETLQSLQKLRHHSQSVFEVVDTLELCAFAGRAQR